MNFITNRFKNIFSYAEEKRRFLVFAFILFMLLFLAFYLIRISFAKYQTTAQLNADVERAFYIFEDEKMDFNLESLGMVPSDTPYTYKFQVMNFKDDKISEIDIDYTVTIKTTTNIPISVSLYKLDADANKGSNLTPAFTQKKDSDGAFYKLYKPSETFSFTHDVKSTDTYQLEITFPSIYSGDMTYEGAIENIDVILESKQKV